MKRVQHIKVNFDDYVKYYEKYKHDRLGKWIKIYPKDGKNKMLKNIGGFIIEEEIFNGIETEYEIVKNNEDYKIKFQTKTNTEYRFDLFKEPNKNIYHLGFSLFNTDLSNYNDLTNKYESLEVFNRIIWILKDIQKILKKDYEYCIGFDLEKKNSIYEYMMRYVTNWERRETTEYPIGWAIYFKLN